MFVVDAWIALGLVDCSVDDDVRGGKSENSRLSELVDVEDAVEEVFVVGAGGLKRPPSRPPSPLLELLESEVVLSDVGEPNNGRMSLACEDDDEEVVFVNCRFTCRGK